MSCGQGQDFDRMFDARRARRDMRAYSKRGARGASRRLLDAVRHPCGKAARRTSRTWILAGALASCSTNWSGMGPYKRLPWMLRVGRSRPCRSNQWTTTPLESYSAQQPARL